MFSAENGVINKLTEVVKLCPADGENSRRSRLVLSPVTLRAAAELLPETSGEAGHGSSSFLYRLHFSLSCPADRAPKDI